MHEGRIMNGLLLAVCLVLVGLLLSALGLWADSQCLMAAGCGALALVWIGGPLILLVGLCGPHKNS